MNDSPDPTKVSLVLYCLVRLRPSPGEPPRFADGQEHHCANWQQCAYPPSLRALEAEFQKDFTARDFGRVPELALAAQETWGK